MNYREAFRDPVLAKAWLERLRASVKPGERYRLMEFCGGHTHAIHRAGLPGLLPAEIELVHGPGCPVCVLPTGCLEQALELSLRPGVTLCTYPDLMRVPTASGRSFFAARAQGADIRQVYSPLAALELARAHPEREVVFLAIGFETTTPPTAVTVQKADQLGLKNFSVIVQHVLTPAAMEALLSRKEERGLEGIIGPAHVSTVIGLKAYRSLSETYRIPIVVAGFEPLDILQSIAMLLELIQSGRPETSNQYRRSVTGEGNQKALALMAEVLEVRESFAWRGLGTVPLSGLRLRPAYRHLDAEERFHLTPREAPEPKGCACGAVLTGRLRPSACRLFGNECTPDTPVGACMVSAEGACAAWYTYHPLPERREDGQP